MKWLWFGLGVVVSGFVCYTLYDLKRELAATTAEVRESNQIVKEKLPPILDNSKKATDSLVTLSSDVSALRNLLAPPASAEGPAADTPVTLAKFADGILSTIEKADVQIGSKGSSYRKATEWVAGERKEAFYLAFRATSRREMLQKMGHTVFGNPWLVKTPDGKTQPLLDWLRKQHPELEADLPPAK